MTEPRLVISSLPAWAAVAALSDAALAASLRAVAGALERGENPRPDRHLRSV
jgi:hypothetical protein